MENDTVHGQKRNDSTFTPREAEASTAVVRHPHYQKHNLS
jgi:hypothetical protein